VSNAWECPWGEQDVDILYLINTLPVFNIKLDQCSAHAQSSTSSKANKDALEK